MNEKELRRSIRNKQQQIRRLDPAVIARDKISDKKRYGKNRIRDIANSRTWNQNNPARKNAINNAYYQRNKDRINKKRRTENLLRKLEKKISGVNT